MKRIVACLCDLFVGLTSVFSKGADRRLLSCKIKRNGMPRIAVFALSIAVVVASVSMNANAEQCTKDFPYHFVTSDGTLGLYHGVGGAWWYPCSLSTTKNGVTPEACKAALAAYITAKAQKQPITISYPGTCALLNSDSSNTDGFVWFGVYWQ